MIPASLCAFASLILFLPDQTRDYYRLLVENLADPDIDVSWPAATIDAVLPLVFLLGMAACISFSAVVLLMERNRRGCAAPLSSGVLTFSPVLFGTLPLLAATAGLYAIKGHRSPDTTDLDAEIQKFGDHDFVGQLNTIFEWAKLSDWYFNLGLWILITVTLAFSLICALIVIRNPQVTAHQRGRAWHIMRWVLVASIVFSLAAIVSVAVFPGPIGQTLGSITVFAVFAGCLAMNATGLSILSRRVDFPIIPALLALAAFLAWTDLNNDHELRRIDKNGHAVSSCSTCVADPAGEVEDQFQKWYEKRIDKDEFKERGYPVYIVAAQGGGIYAAAQSAQFLQSCTRRVSEFPSTYSRSAACPGAAWALRSTPR